MRQHTLTCGKFGPSILNSETLSGHLDSIPLLLRAGLQVTHHLDLPSII
jgi:hypothetical protein